MAGEQANIGVGRGPGLQAGNMPANDQPIQPLRRDIELGVGRQGVGTVEPPSVAVPEGDSAVAAGMTEEGDEVHLG